MRAFHVGLFVCSFISVSAVASKCFVENDEPSFLQSSAPNRTVTLAAVPPLNNETQQPEVAKPLRGRKIGNQQKRAEEKPKQVPAAGNASDPDEDDDLFPPDDPHAPGPWQDICAISGSTFFATMLLCFVWFGSLWSAFGSEMDSDGTGLSRRAYFELRDRKDCKGEYRGNIRLCQSVTLMTYSSLFNALDRKSCVPFWNSGPTSTCHTCPWQDWLELWKVKSLHSSASLGAAQIWRQRFSHGSMWTLLGVHLRWIRTKALFRIEGSRL